MRINRSMANKNLRLHASRRRRPRRIQTSMHAHHSRQLRPAPRQLQHRHSAEAIPHRRHSPIHQRLRSQHLQPRSRSRAQFRAVRSKLHQPRHNPFPIPRNACSIHVARKHHKSLLRKPPRPTLRMFIQPRASMHHQNPRPPPAPRLIPNQLPSQRNLPILVLNYLRPHRHRFVLSNGHALVTPQRLQNKEQPAL